MINSNLILLHKQHTIFKLHFNYFPKLFTNFYTIYFIFSKVTYTFDNMSSIINQSSLNPFL